MCKSVAGSFYSVGCFDGSLSGPLCYVSTSALVIVKQRKTKYTYQIVYTAYLFLQNKHGIANVF